MDFYSGTIYLIKITKTKHFTIKFLAKSDTNNWGFKKN